MNHDLYFVPILAHALEGPDRSDSLAVAFAAIEELGQKTGFEEGYRNFCRFLAEVFGHRQLLDERDLRMAALEGITGAPSEIDRWHSVLAKLAEKTVWLRGECDALHQACMLRPRVLTLHMLRDGQSIAELTFETAAGRRTVNDIHPGLYALKLSTGLVLWQGIFAAADLIWTQAFGAEGLALAAETGEARRRVSREMQVPEAHLILRLFPGLESGTLEVELSP